MAVAVDVPGGAGAGIQARAGIRVRSRARLVLLALPFVILAVVGISWLVLGPGWDLLLLMAVGPAVAAGVGALVYTLTAGVAALAESLAFTVGLPSASRHPAQIMFLAVAGVTAASVLTGRERRRRERELAQTRLVADVAQRVLLRPVPDRVGPVGLAVHYQSAASGARIGGDLYEVVTTPDCVRLIVGDVEGKGLPAVALAAAVLGVFREAAYEEGGLDAIAARIEASLTRQLGAEQFVTAVLAEISPGGDKVELLSCGHPAPLLLRAGQPRLLAPSQNGLPLGLGQLADVPRIPLVISLEPGDELLFYTDGVSEARNKAGEFFPLAYAAAAQPPAGPATRVDRLGDAVIRHVGHAPDDDIALLLVQRDAA
jgi:serine phosphatase RsbU (regulator of sigma subunit)